MADIALKAATSTAVATLPNIQHTFIANAAMDRLTPVYIVAATGKVAATDADADATADAWGVTARDCVAGEAVTVIRQGLVDGLTLDSLNYGATLYVSGTAGRIADAAGAAEKVVGHVLPVAGTTIGVAADKLFYVDCTAPLIPAA